MSEKILKFWPVIVTLLTMLCGLITVVYQLSTMRSSIIHASEVGERDRSFLHTQDERLEKRVEKVEDEIEPIQRTLVRIETNQQNVIDTIKSIDRKLQKGTE